MAKQIRDGWHLLCGYKVYVEGGVILRGVKKDYNGGLVTSWVYRWSDKQHCWVNEGSITPDAFRAGVRRGTIDMK